MADVGINALYPQPPARADGLMTGDPSRVIGLMNALNQNVLQQQQIRAGQGIEKVYDGAINPDGSVNNALVMSRAPAAGVRAPEIVTALQGQQGQRIANTTAQFEQATKQNQFVMDGIGTLADKPNVTRDDVNNFVVAAARNTGVPAPMLNAWVRSLPTGGKALKESLVAIRNMAIGAAPTAGRVEGAPDASGAPTKITAGQANYEGAGVGAGADISPKSVKTEAIRPGISTALPPGEAGLMEDSAKRFSALRATAGTSPQNKADLENLLHDTRILGDIAGPTVEIEKRIGSLAQRLGIKEGFTLGKDKQAAAESFDKIVSQLASNQQKQMSDAGLHVAQSMNPSLMMSGVGREGVINMLRGNQDALDRIRYEANKAKIPAGQYDQWMQDFGQKLDIRVFQFNRMNRDQQQKFLNNMDPAEIPAFEKKYQAAIGANWVDPLKPK